MKTLRQCQDKQIWNDYVLDNGGNPLQLWGWGELKAIHNWSVRRLHLVDEEGEIFGGAQVITRHLPFPFRSLSYIPRGPIVDEANRAEMLELLASYVKTNLKSITLSIEPDDTEYEVPEGWIKSKNRILPSHTIILDLSKNESELLSDMAKKTRQYIRKSSAEQIKIKNVKTREDLEKCLDIYHETNRRAKFNIHSDQYYFDAFNMLEDHAQVFAAYSDNQPIAFLWLAVSEKTAYELYGGMNQLGQDLRVNYALKWHAIRKCKQWGIDRYDFGGLINGGVSTFKLTWTSSETELIGTFDKPLSFMYKLWSYGLPLAKKTVQKIQAIFKK